MVSTRRSEWASSPLLSPFGSSTLPPTSQPLARMARGLLAHSKRTLEISSSSYALSSAEGQGSGTPGRKKAPIPSLYRRKPALVDSAADSSPKCTKTCSAFLPRRAWHVRAHRSTSTSQTRETIYFVEHIVDHFLAESRKKSSIKISTLIREKSR